MKIRNSLALGLALVMLSGLTGCGEEAVSDTVKPAQPQGTAGEQEYVQPSAHAEEQTEAEENWGLTYSRQTVRDNVYVNYNISFPDFLGILEGKGAIERQLDGSVVVVAGETFDCPIIDDIDAVFPAYFSELRLTVKGFWGPTYSDHAFEVKSQERETVNGIEMARYNGDLSLKMNGEAKVFHWVAYATQLEQNKAIAYWVVIDATENNSLGDKIADTAYKMALTYEEQLN